VELGGRWRETSGPSLIRTSAACYGGFTQRFTHKE
jgi:hypothetical protein